MALSEPLELQYLDEIERFEQEKHMTYITSAERIGIQKGMQQGMQKGLLQGERAILLRQLQRKFGVIQSHYQKRIEQAGAEDLLGWADTIISASSLDEVFGK